MDNLESSSAEDRLLEELKQEERKEGDVDKTIQFSDKDIIDGKCFKLDKAITLGENITRLVDDEEVIVTASNEVCEVGYVHSYYREHSTQLLSDVTMPKKEVDDYEIHQVDRKFFQGENSIRLVERVLNIDSGLIHKSYRYG